MQETQDNGLKMETVKKKLKRNYYDYIQVRNIKHKGRGVFALKPFKPEETIEVCHVILLDQHLEQNNANGYCFAWSDDYVAIALGYGSLYNHSHKPNAEYCCFDSDDDLRMRFYASKPIKVGEEICISYLEDHETEDDLWFDYKR